MRSTTQPTIVILDVRHSAAGTAIIVADRVQGAPLLRRSDPSSSDVTRRIAEALGHHRGQVLGLAGDAGAGAHGVAVLRFEMRRRLAPLQRAGRIHYQLSKMQ